MPGKNSQAAVVAVGYFVISLFMVAIIAYTVYDLVRLVGTWRQNNQYMQSKRASLGQGVGLLADNEVYEDKRGEDVIKDGEYAKFTAKLKEIQTTYEKYNEKVRIQNVPDHVVGNSALSAQHDDYKPPRGPDAP